MTDFRQRYGECAIVTGASSGIGEAFAHALAARGVKPILVARRVEELDRVATDVEKASGVACVKVAGDLADPSFILQLEEACADLDVGLVIGNAAYNPAGAFLDMSREVLLRMLDVNNRANVLLANAFLPRLKERGRGGFLMVGSTEGFFGVPYSSVYSATKGFVLSLGEGLWGECADFGVDVLVLAPGATDTPLLASRNLGGRKIEVMSPRAVAEVGLDNLGRGPVVVPGKGNQRTAFMMRLLPRRWLVRTMGNAVRQIVAASTKPA